MSMTANMGAVADGVFALPEAERADLAYRLLGLHPEGVFSETDTRWAQEMHRRLEAIEPGTYRAVDWQAELVRLRQQFGPGHSETRRPGDAVQDVATAMHWYESRRCGLGIAFSIEVENAVRRIESAPSQFARLEAIRLDVPSKQLLVLNYRLTETATIQQSASGPKAEGAVQCMYDEPHLVPGAKQVYMHSILLSNDWSLEVRLRKVRAIRAKTLYPTPGTVLVPTTSGRRPWAANDTNPIMPPLDRA